MEIHTRTVDLQQDGTRIDKWLAAIEDWTRSQVQQWIKDGAVKVNGKTVKANYKIQAEDVVEVSVRDPEPLEVVAEPIPLDIVYEDEDVIVVNKPQGMVVHPAPGHETGTLVNALLYHCRDLSGINGTIRPGIVHRIDKDTSGLLVVAKNDRAHKCLSEQLKAKTIERTYKAIVHGVLKHDHGKIDAPIGRDEKDRKKMAVTDKNSVQAVTHFTVLERFDRYTFVECRLETGRTHQIRVHMHFIGHPVAADPKYGPRKSLPLPGQALHAAVLGFEHPATGEQMRFEAEMPKTMTEALRQL
ncbi:MAG TPA: RluA family pseudouridine synthase [Bacillales bacterium]|nr:RluA family pseudouridine synthase [Bacillales bacterium]